MTGVSLLKTGGDVVFGVESPPLTCGCAPFDCKVFRKGTKVDVPGVQEVNVTRGTALTIGDKPRVNKNTRDIVRWVTEGVEARCKHGLVKENHVR